MVRTGLPGRLEHFVAYAGSAAIAMAGYGANRGGMQIIGGFWVYAGILEYLQHFSPGRHPAIEDFAASRTWSAMRRSCYRPPLAARVLLAPLKAFARIVIDRRSTAASLTRIVRSSTLIRGLSPRFSKAAGAAATVL
jgi:hypothetical protein